MTQDPFSSQAADNFLSTRAPQAKWPKIGYVVEGTVMGWEMEQQTDYDTGALLTWSDGKPRMQLVMTIQSKATGKTWTGLHNEEKSLPNDDGMRTLYIKGALQKSFSRALSAARCKLAVGAHVSIERIADGPKSDPKKAAPHLHKVKWLPPTQNEQAAADFLADNEESSPAGGNETPF